MDFDFSAETAARAQRELSLPPEPPKPPERSAWGWVPRITKAAVAGVAGSVADVVKGAAAADALTLGADPRARGAFTDEQLQAGQAEGMRQIATSEALTSDIGESFRQVQKDARPDPVTAGEAERLVFGVAEPMLKLIGAGMTMGPVGLGLASAEMGLQQSDDLRQQGVDPMTRTAVGGLTAAVTGASVALPLVGPTLAKTGAYYLAGGPGGFMAQQAITSKILEHAGYDKIAEQFDPLDPMGLALSALIPLPFAGYGAMRNIRAMKPAKGAAPAVDVPVTPEVPTVPRETVDAAMVHNLTLQRQAQDAVPPVARAAEVMRGPVTENPNFKAWFGESKVVDETGKPLVVYHGTRGDIEAFDPARVKERFPNSEGIYLTTRHDQASVYADSVQNAAENFNPASRFGKPVAEGANVVPAYVSLRNPKIVETTGMLESAVDGDNGAMVRQARADGFDGIIVKRNAGDEYDGSLVIAFRPEQIKSAIGNSGDFNPASASLTDPRPAPPPAPKPDPAPAALAEAIAKAKEELAAFKASGKTLYEFADGRGLPPAVNNLLIGLAETLKNPAKAKALLDMVGKSDPKADPANVTADAVERVRTLTDAELTNTPPDTIAAKPDPLMKSVSDRVAAVEMTSPDMPIGIREDGTPITVADELERIRKEAAEGTDATLGGDDARLIDVAANCALSMGAA